MVKELEEFFSTILLTSFEKDDAPAAGWICPH
jgi:hypothetical protein